LAKKIGPFEIDEKLMFKMKMFSGEDVEHYVSKSLDEYQKGIAPIYEEHRQFEQKMSFQEGALGGLLFGILIAGTAFVLTEVMFDEGWKDFGNNKELYGN
jgi:hypothetical protein